jgi:hypothetical protein
MALISVTIDHDTDEIPEWAKDNCKSFKDSNRLVSSMTFTVNPTNHYYGMNILSPVVKYSATYNFEDEHDAAFFLLRWS